MADAKDAEVLLWVGCGGALVERNQKVVRSIAQLLEKAGVKFAILGREEKCTGDPARRIGNEFLFETLAQENIATLDRYQVKTIVTSCPHCFNTFANEYPQFGGRYEVYHHSEYLAKLVGRRASCRPKCPRTRRSRFTTPVTWAGTMACTTRRGSWCRSRPAARRLRWSKAESNGFCCGGGGGMSFIDEPPNQRVNQERARQVLETDADIVAVGCPFCMTMLEDGINARKGDRDTRVMDVAELLWQAVEQSAPS